VFKTCLKTPAKTMCAAQKRQHRTGIFWITWFHATRKQHKERIQTRYSRLSLQKVRDFFGLKETFGDEEGNTLWLVRSFICCFICLFVCSVVRGPGCRVSWKVVGSRGVTGVYAVVG